MKRPALFHWIIIIVAAATILGVAFIYFRNPGATYSEINRSAEIHYANGTGGSNATFGVILPYLATPH